MCKLGTICETLWPGGPPIGIGIRIQFFVESNASKEISTVYNVEAVVQHLPNEATELCNLVVHFNIICKL